MIKSNKSKLRILSLVVLAALLLALLPSAALADSFSAAVKVKKMKVYADPRGEEYIGSLPNKTIVTVQEYSGGVAKIKYNGVTGYAKVSDMRSVESFAEEAKTNTSTRVYAEANPNSASAKLKSGVQVYVLAEKNGIAMIEKDGKVGYVNASHLTYTSKPVPDVEPDVGNENTISGSDIVDALPDKVVEVLPDSVIDEVKKGEYTQSQLEDLKAALEAEYNKYKNDKDNADKNTSSSSTSIESIFASGKYSNEQLTFLFAVKVMGYNPAAAAGLLSNISAESGFRPNASGDSDRSYGICQWFSGRKTRLINYCGNRGLDYTTLYAQLCFLKYELETYYPSVHRYMKNVENSADGAYDAAYYFCFNFEAPANKASKSTSRGNNAKNIFYPRYENYI